MPRRISDASPTADETAPAVAGAVSSVRPRPRASGPAAAHHAQQERDQRDDADDQRDPQQLRARAKELGLTGYSGKRKSELIDMLRED